MDEFEEHQSEIDCLQTQIGFLISENQKSNKLLRIILDYFLGKPEHYDYARIEKALAALMDLEVPRNPETEKMLNEFLDYLKMMTK